LRLAINGQVKRHEIKGQKPGPVQIWSAWALFYVVRLAAPSGLSADIGHEKASRRPFYGYFEKKSAWGLHF
jgi:hypothetical protein